MDERLFWLGFSLVSAIGPRRVALLREHFGSLEKAWQADEKALREARLDQRSLQSLLESRKKRSLEGEWERVDRAGARVLTPLDDEYPPLLKPLPDAPTALYVKGTLTPEDERAIAVVGTRKATQYGRSASHHLSKELAQQGVTIISGLAFGIDAAAHQGALEAGGRTIAVLGCGIDRVYPADHAPLARTISEHGALISEFPLGTPPDKRNFPRRNRIISGIALGVLVVEAPEKSGALITALIAAEQGRDVFAVPGSIYNASSRGGNRLIQDGAKLVLDAADIIGELQIVKNRAETHLRLASALAHPENELEAQVLALLDHEPIYVDDVARNGGLPVAVVSSVLTMLELKGLAQNVGHMQYCLSS